MTRLTIEITDALAQRLAWLASEQKKSVEQVEVEQLESLLVVLGRSMHIDGGVVSEELHTAQCFRKDARMTTPLAPSPAVCPPVQLTARQRACLERMARRQTRPQRLVRRAKML